jgi:hypothetical protein
MAKFSPMGWAGSRSAIVESNARLLDELNEYSDIAFSEFIAKEKVRLAKTVEAERYTETLIERARDERFE